MEASAEDLNYTKLYYDNCTNYQDHYFNKTDS